MTIWSDFSSIFTATTTDRGPEAERRPSKRSNERVCRRSAVSELSISDREPERRR